MQTVLQTRRYLLNLDNRFLTVFDLTCWRLFSFKEVVKRTISFLGPTILFSVIMSEPCVASEPGFVVNELEGHTTSVGSRASFLIELTSRPDGNVVIPIESSDPLEGVPMVSEIVFSPFDWNTRQIVYVEGRNADVFNGEQDYHIVLGPVASNDPLYEGLDPEDVHVIGLNLSLVDSGPLYFVPGLVQRHDPIFDHNGFASTHVMASGPTDLTVSEQGSIEWTPPDTAQGSTATVEIVSTLNDVLFTSSLEINVLPYSDVSVSRNNESFKVTDNKSSLDGYIFTNFEDEPSEFWLREVPQANLPPLGDGQELLTLGFYSGAAGEMDLYIPVEQVAEFSTLFRLAYYRWSERYSEWLLSTFHAEMKELDGIKYRKLSLTTAKGLGVIVVEPTSSDR